MGFPSNLFYGISSTLEAMDLDWRRRSWARGEFRNRNPLEWRKVFSREVIDYLSGYGNRMDEYVKNTVIRLAQEAAIDSE